MTFRRIDEGKVLEKWQELGLIEPTNDGFLTEQLQGFAQGGLGVLQGMGSTAEELGMGSGLREYAEDTMAVNRHLGNHRGYKAASLNPGNIGRTIGTGVAQSLGALGVGAAATAAAAGNPVAGIAAGSAFMWGQLYGNRVKEYREMMPHQAEDTIKGLAFVSALGESVIENLLGPEQLARGIAARIATRAMRETTKSLVRRVGAEAAKSAIIEGSEEVIQDFWNRCVAYAGTGGLELPSFGEVMEQFAGGAYPGAVLGGAGAVVDNATDTEPETAVTAPAEQAQETPEESPVQDTPESYQQVDPVQEEPESVETPVQEPETAPVEEQAPAAVEEPEPAAVEEPDAPPVEEQRPAPDYKDSEDLIKKLGNSLGFTVHYMDEPNQMGNATELGHYDASKPGEFWIDRRDPDYDPVQILGHEFKHFLDAEHPDLVQEFNDAVAASLTDEGRAEIASIRQAYEDGGANDADAQGEFLADTFGRAWMTREFWDDVAARVDAKSDWGNKFWTAVGQFFKRVKRALKSIGGPDAKQMFDNVKHIEELAAQAMADYRTRYKQGGQAQTQQAQTQQAPTASQHTEEYDKNIYSEAEQVPLSEINLDPARFQFKGGTNKATGVNEKNKIGGDWDARTAGPVYIWEDKTGKKFIVNGHHRLALAKEQNIPVISAYVDRESDGVTAEQARTNGVLMNIRDGQGDIKDYAAFVRDQGMDEEEAERQGLLAREKSRKGYIIGHYASENLYNVFLNDDYSDAKIYAIANAARGNEKLEKAALVHAKDKSPAELAEYIRIAQNIPQLKQHSQQMDLFELSDDGLNATLQKMSDLAVKHRNALVGIIRTSEKVIEHPERYKNTGIRTVSDAQTKLKNAQEELARWAQWEKHEDLRNQLMEEAGIEPDAKTVAQEEAEKVPTSVSVPNQNDAFEQKKADLRSRMVGLVKERYPKIEDFPNALDDLHAQFSLYLKGDSSVDEALAAMKKYLNSDAAVKELETRYPQLRKTPLGVGQLGHLWSKRDKQRLYFSKDGLERVLGINQAHTGNYNVSLEKYGPYVDIKDFTFHADSYSQFPEEIRNKLIDAAKAAMADENVPAPAAEPEAPKAEQPEQKPEADLPSLLRETIELENVNMQTKKARLKKLAKSFGLDEKSIEEQTEAVIVRMAREINDSDLSEREKYDRLVSLYNKQPILGSRTSTSMINQAYSTPAPLAWILGNHIGLKGKLTFEPTAGTGMLTVAGTPSKTYVNEINDVRRAILDKQGFAEVTSHDALTSSPNRKFDRIIMNPPFGTHVNEDGTKVEHMDHEIARRALDTMKPDGRAAIIIGANSSDKSGAGRPVKADHRFLEYLYQHYNVEDAYVLNKDLFSKQGANYPVRILTVNGRRSTPAPKNGYGFYSPQQFEMLDSWDAVYDKLQGEIDEHSQPERSDSVEQGGRDDAVQEGESAPGNGSDSRRSGSAVAADSGKGADEGGAEGRSKPGEHEPAGAGSVEPAVNGDEQSSGDAGPDGQRAGLGDRSGGLSADDVSGSGRNDGGNDTGQSGAAGHGTGVQSPSGPADGSNNGRPNGLAKPHGYGDKNAVFTRDNYLEALEKLRESLHHVNSGVDPTILVNGTIVAGYHIEAGARKFIDYARAMIGDLGEEIKPYLKSLYAAIRRYPGMEEVAKDMDSDADIDSIDLDKALQEPSPTNDSKPERVSELNDRYQPGSHSSSKMDVLVPHMLATPIREAIETLRDDVGNVDGYVKEQLGYDSEDALYNALSDVQIDGVAQTIHSFKDGHAFIIGDETGLGKGRQCAAVLRWGKRHGYMPIFFTQKPTLFKSMYEDFQDIGESMNPLIMGSKPDADITDSENRLIFSHLEGKKRKDAFEEMLKGDSPYDMVMATYSQIQIKNNAQQKFLRDLIKTRKTLVVLDESHTASGQDSNIGQFFVNNPKDLTQLVLSLTGRTEPGLLQHDDVKVLYASATFAKRPDNLVLYSRTNISKGVMKTSKLSEVLKEGGIPLQQLLTEELARDGQYTRREKDFSGVKFDVHTANPMEEFPQAKSEAEATRLQRERFDRVAGTLERLIHFNRILIERMKDLLRTYFSQKKGESQALEAMNFASVTHNYIARLLFASKCDLTVRHAMESFKRGEKPVITVDKTEGTMLDYYANKHGISPGGTIDMTFADSLLAGLDRMYTFTAHADGFIEGQEFKDGGTVTLSPQFLGLTVEDEQVRNKIKELSDISLPISPIDYIREKLTAEGVKIGEISGRSSGVRSEDGRLVLYKRTPDDMDTNKTINAFNSGKLDALILNSAGSTGISLHASVKFKDQKPRHMIMAQPSNDINVVIQTFGRIKRSGQVVQPSYEILTSSLTAEQRSSMNLSRKMQSLNANTTGNNKGDIQMGIDFFNKYGDAIAAQYLTADHPLSERLGLSPQAPDLMRALTGKMAILPDKMQKDIFEDLTERYKNMVEYLKSINEYDLEMSVHDDWNAETLKTIVMKPGDEHGSVFTQPIYLNRIRYNETYHNQKPEDVLEAFRKGMPHNPETGKIDIGSIVNPRLEAINNLVKEYDMSTPQNREFVENKQRYQREAIERFKSLVRNLTGNLITFYIGEKEYQGTLTSISIPKRINPLTPFEPSLVKFNIAAINSPIPKLPLVMSRMEGGGFNYQIGAYVKEFLTDLGFTEDRIQNMDTVSLADLYDGKKTTRPAERYAFTGNVMGAVEIAKKGQVMSYMTNKGTLQTALVMPKSWQANEVDYDPREEMTTADQVMTGLQSMEIVHTDGDFNIQRINNVDYVAYVPKGRKGGTSLSLSPELRKITGDFSSSGPRMVTKPMPASQTKRLVGFLIKKAGVVFTPGQSEAFKTKHMLKPQTRNGDGSRIYYSLRRAPAPSRTKKAYKMFKVDADGSPHALFIDKGNALSLGEWYDADSPQMNDLKGLEPGHTYLIDADGNATMMHYANKAQTPSKAELSTVAGRQERFIYVGTYANGEKKFENWGINGSGAAAKFAMRPGWHATNIPAARHIGANENGKPTWRRPDERWFEIEMAADEDYNDEARQNPNGDIPDHLPTDGWYGFQTNTNANKAQDWYISGAIKINRALDKAEADQIAVSQGYEPDLPYKDGKTSYMLKRQANPIREEGPIQDEYEEQLDDYDPGHQSEDSVTARAARKLHSHGGVNGVVQDILNGDFKPKSAVAQRMMQLILNSDEFKSMAPELRSKVADAYMVSGSELGRALASRRLGAFDMERLESVQAHVNAMSAKLPPEKAKSLRDDIMKQFGIDINNLPESIVNDVDKLDAILREMASRNASLFDKFYEFWISAILSGPATHGANIGGNTVNASYELGLKRLVEATLNLVAQKKDAATFGEFKAISHAVNWKDAWKRAKLAFSREMIGRESKLENIRAAIGGKAGRMIRIPGRLLRAADEFAKAIIAPIEATSYAYRQGRVRNLKGQALRDYIAHEVEDPDSMANGYARDRAIELTFQEDPGAAVNKLIQWRESGGVFGKILKFTLPFLKTPHNIMKQGIKKSPLASLSLAKDTADILRHKRTVDAAYLGKVAEQIIAWGAFMAFWPGDDDEPMITGTSDRYGSNEQKFKANKIPPYSIRIGDTWYSYRRIEPLASGLALIADGIQAVQDAENGKDGTRVLKRLMGSAGQVIVEKSFLDSLGQITKLASDPERSAAQIVTNFAASWMPNVVRQTMGAFDDNVRDSKSRERGLAWWQDQFNVVTDRMGLTHGAPKIDYFGREIKKDALEGSNPLGQLARLIPVRAVKDDMDPAERLMWNWNRQNPDEEYWPGVPAYWFKRDGRKWYFTHRNYTDFARDAGQLAHRRIQEAFARGLLHENNPTERDIKLIQSIFSRARSEVRERMYKEGCCND